MLTADYLDVLPNSMVALYSQYETSIIKDIARRLAKLDFATAAWQVQRLSEAGGLYKDIIKKISRLTGISQQELRKLFKAAGVRTMKFDDAVYIKAGLKPIPLNMSPAMAQVLAAGLEKTNGILYNLTMTTANTAQAAFIKAADLAYYQVSTGAMSYTEAINAAIKSIASEGIKMINYETGKADQVDVAVRRTVLTGVAQTAGKLQMKRADEMGADLIETSAHAGARNRGDTPENHELWQGRVFTRGLDPANKDYPNFYQVTGYGTGVGLMGWNCVLGDTVIISPAIRAGYRREYSGEIIVIRTAGGKELSVTPNHPILTDHGWVAAGLLHSGDNVICYTGANRSFSISPDINQGVSRIEDIFDSLCISGKRFNLPVSSCNFHGDISDGEVEIVFSDSFLRNGGDTSLQQELIEIEFGAASCFPEFFMPESALSQVVISASHSSDGVMGSSSEGESIIGGHTREPVRHCDGAIITDTDAELIKIPANEPFRYSDFGSNLIFPEPGFIQGEELGGCNAGFSPETNFPVIRFDNTVSLQAVLDGMYRTPVFFDNEIISFTGHEETDNIVIVERKSTQGSFIHVYNLQTEGEWYSANGIITHNCRHSFYPFFEGLSIQAYNEQQLKELNKTVIYNGQELSQYEATQVQRGIERKIRHWKRQVAGLEENEKDTSGKDLKKAKLKVKQWQAKMRDFTKQTGLDRERERERILAN